MHKLENELIYNINCGNAEKALEVYKKLFYSFRFYDLGNSCCFRSMKNHIICLNSILYKNCYNDFICKQYIYKKRNNFIDEIEKQNSLKNLFVLGEQIIVFYIDILTKKSIYTENPTIREALKYIHSHVGEDLTLKKVANAIHISENHLSNLFPKATGYNFSIYINKVKIEKSKMILKNSNHNILDIALECGFNSQSYFCYIFKKITGTTPTQYRAAAIEG